MRVAVISPHLDDAVFSVAENMLSRPDWHFDIVCPFGGIPDDPAGKTKYERLLEEHYQVLDATGWGHRTGPFLDDVYGPVDMIELRVWFGEQLSCNYDAWWSPRGIHHPDHCHVAEVIRALGRPRESLSIYEELPYRVLYPGKYGLRSGELMGYDPAMLDQKKILCRMYASQIGPDVERCLYVPERLWGRTW